LILLDLQLINFPQACIISQEAPSCFPHFLQPWLQGFNQGWGAGARAGHFAWSWSSN